IQPQLGTIRVVVLRVELGHARIVAIAEQLAAIEELAEDRGDPDANSDLQEMLRIVPAVHGHPLGRLHRHAPAITIDPRRWDHEPGRRPRTTVPPRWPSA